MNTEYNIFDQIPAEDRRLFRGLSLLRENEDNDEYVSLVLRILNGLASDPRLDMESSRASGRSLEKSIEWLPVALERLMPDGAATPALILVSELRSAVQEFCLQWDDVRPIRGGKQ